MPDNFSATILAAAAVQTKNIRLTSAVSVLSSDDPVRVFQQYATVDLLSSGRVELMVGRGSFIESFPLFGYDLEDYDLLFAEKLQLLMEIRENEVVTWEGQTRKPIEGRGVYPRPLQDPLPLWIAIGGTPQSAARAGYLGLPLALAIIGGMTGNTIRRVEHIFALSSLSLPISGQRLGGLAALHGDEDERGERDQPENSQCEEGAKECFHRLSPQTNGRGLDRYWVRIALIVQ